MALEEFCAACTELSENGDYSGKYYCFNFGEDHYACDPKCHRFCEAYSRSDSARRNMYNNSLNHQGGGCYLTTAMCDILGYEDNNYYLEMLRTFRDTTLKNNIKYIPLLITYDIIGPQIANNLINDENKTKIATYLFNNYIVKAVTSIENDKTQDAINIYIAMTESLAKRYNINNQILFINPESINLDTIDYQSLGHARTRKKEQEN